MSKDKGGDKAAAVGAHNKENGPYFVTMMHQSCLMDLAVDSDDATPDLTDPFISDSLCL